MEWTFVRKKRGCSQNWCHKNEILFSWRNPSRHTQWPCPGREISSAKPPLSHHQRAVCSGPMRTLQTCMVLCLCQRVWKISLLAWAAQIVSSLTSMVRVNSLETLHCYQDSSLMYCQGRQQLGPPEQESSRPESRRDIKPGADRHKVNEKYQNGEATWRTGKTLIYWSTVMQHSFCQVLSSCISRVK